MATQVSPGVVINEIDKSDSLTQVALNAGAIAGPFAWGPIEEVVTVSNETQLVNVFGKPNNDTAVHFFTASNFLGYSGTLRVVRAANTTVARNATQNTSGVLIKNRDHFEGTVEPSSRAVPIANSVFVAKYAGVLGNSLKVSVCSNGNTLAWGAWTYAKNFTVAPGTSDYASLRNGANDEMHIIVLDEDGLITGTPGTVLEKYQGLSKASDALGADGSNIYFKDVINNQSAWLWVLNPNPNGDTGNTWGTVVSTTPYKTLSNLDVSLSGGVAGETSVNYDDAHTKLADETVDISFVMGADAPATRANAILSNIVAARPYVMAFFSPEKSDVVGTANPTQNAIDYRNELTSTSFAVMDSGWKYQYDKFNQIYRWIPLNGDVAGLTARAEQTSEAWFSPAGFTRGQMRIGNTIKLAWNPNQTQRDDLYLKGINPVVAFPGEGTVLFGDKTLQAKPSAFDRINVRRLFIVLEKTIERSAKYQLFEQNDEFTRNSFINLIEPFLRSVKGRRGISDFYIVCDETNNPPDAVDRNEFRADIYIKPIRSINFIQLNFVAVRSDVSFNEVITNLG